MSKGSPILQFRLSPQLLEQLKQEAAERDLTVSDVIREAIALYFAAKKA